VIEVHQVHKRFGERTALQNVSLSVAQGEVVAVLGANGSGKSTLLRVLAGIVTPDSGTLTVCGQNVLTDRVAANRHVGLVLDSASSWYTRLSGTANLEFFAALRGLGGRAARRAATDQIELVGIGDDAHRPVGTTPTVCGQGWRWRAPGSEIPKSC
jgi:ABC-2 type transport system ATP-binding protein